MKKLLLLSSALIGLTAAAQAADLGYKKPSPVPVMAAYNWTGFYVGLQGGFGWGSNKHSNGVITSGTINNNGGLIGATVGYNYQLSNRIVLGAEADYAWASLKDTSPVGCAAPGCTTNIRSIGTARARLGYAFDRILPYITAGAAFGDVKASAGLAPAFTSSSFRAGWTIGAGVEAAVWQNVSVKAEYLYYDLGKFKYDAAATIHTTTRGHLARVGVNYRF